MARQLRQARYNRRLTLLEVEVASGHTRYQISDWERGRCDPHLRAFIDWANALDFDVVLQHRISA
jgi:transcriptional regulator with XRE-family HTH domain